MPYAPMKPCSAPGCGKLTHDRYCDQHAVAAKEEKRETERQRGSASARGYGRPWQKYRAGFIRNNPLCCVCEAEGRVEPTTDVDHIKPHRGDQKLFWDKNNHQGLCHPCHSRKTATEDGGFGHPRRG